MKRIHFIALGGSIMHNLAIALKQRGFHVTGSDDEIFEPARSRLEKYRLLPNKKGWDSGEITRDLDAIILGMHAKSDNPELQRALELNIPVYSFPEFIYAESRDKTRVVIAGSHGKTTITGMVMHILRHADQNFDYMVGARLKGFENMVRLSDDSPAIVLEGDEYLASVLKPRPKFLFYKPDIALLSGIAWDHINAFPSYENYLQAFRDFFHTMKPGSQLVFNEEDPEVRKLIEEAGHLEKIPYATPDFSIRKGKWYMVIEDREIPLKVFGQHNIQNLMGALTVTQCMGIPLKEGMRSVSSFEGAASRLEALAECGETHVFRDYAHSPSKVSATVRAVKETFPDQKLSACLELHTFSSLDPNFLSNYHHTMSAAEEKIIFYDPEALALKRMHLSKEDIFEGFGETDLLIFNKISALISYLKEQDWSNRNLLFMSSGSFAKTDLNDLATFVCSSVK